MTTNSCARCRYHTHKQQPRVVGVFDGDLEMIEEDDTVLEDVYGCAHPQGTKSIAIGNEQAEIQARDCSHFDVGSKSKLSADLERLLAQRAQRAVTRED